MGHELGEGHVMDVGTDLARRAPSRPDALTPTPTLAPRVARSLARFEDDTAFNQDLSGWDVDLVTDPGTCDMFSCLAGFNPISRIPSWRYRSSCGTPGCPPPSG